MQTKTQKTLGIIGGMGPMATVDLFRKIVSETKASSDSEHIHILIDNRPDIPDRTQAILAGKDTPVSYIVESAHRLEAAGADVLLIPCNTSHCFFDQIAEKVALPIIHMIRETARSLQLRGIDCVGLLATEGVVRVGVYSRVLAEFGIRVLTPDAAGQALVTHMIYNEVKAGLVPRPDALESLFLQMEAAGAQVFVLGCTELPLAFDGYASIHDFADPTLILAHSAIRAAGYEIKSSETH